MFSKYTLLPLLHHLDLVSSLDRIGCVILKTQELEGNLYKVATNQDLKAANYYLFSRYTLYSAIFFNLYTSPRPRQRSHLKFWRDGSAVFSFLWYFVRINISCSRPRLSRLSLIGQWDGDVDTVLCQDSQSSKQWLALVYSCPLDIMTWTALFNLIPEACPHKIKL